MLDPRVEDDPLPGLKAVDAVPEASTTPAPSAPRIRGFGTDGRPLRTQTSRWLSADVPQPHEDLARAGDQVGHLLEREDVGPPVLVDACGQHGTIVA